MGEKENSSGVTKALMTVISIRTISTEMVNTSGPMAESTMDNGLTTKWKVKVPLLGVMVVDMLVNTKMTRSMGKVHLNGQMAESISENGTKVNNTDKVPT